MDQEKKRAIMLDNYQTPANKEIPTSENYLKVNTRNESCVDNLDLYVLFSDEQINEVKFMGEACAIAISSASIMTKILKEKTLKEALELVDNFIAMTNNETYNKSILEEALAFDEIYRQPNRITCANLPWKGIKKAIEKYKA